MDSSRLQTTRFEATGFQPVEASLFLKVDFVGIGLVVRSRIRDAVCHDFGKENSRVWAHEFCYGLA